MSFGSVCLPLNRIHRKLLLRTMLLLSNSQIPTSKANEKLAIAVVVDSNGDPATITIESRWTIHFVVAKSPNSWKVSYKGVVIMHIFCKVTNNKVTNALGLIPIKLLGST